MPNFPLGAWLFLTSTLLAIVGVAAWMVEAGDLPGEVLYAALTGILTAVVGVVFHNAGATAALASPTPPAVPAAAPVVTPAPTVIPVPQVPPVA